MHELHLHAACVRRNHNAAKLPVNMTGCRSCLMSQVQVQVQVGNCQFLFPLSFDCLLTIGDPPAAVVLPRVAA